MNIYSALQMATLHHMTLSQPRGRRLYIMFFLGGCFGILILFAQLI